MEKDKCTCELNGSSCETCGHLYTINRGLPGALIRSRARESREFPSWASNDSARQPVVNQHHADAR